MRDYFEKIQGRKIEEILNNPDLLRSLLILASNLLLNGQQPILCNSCIIDYYIQIINNFEMLNKNYEAMKNRTCKPKWVGIKYSKGAFYNSETITDEQAINALKNGYLTEKDFEVLPEGLIGIKNEAINEANDEIELIEKTENKRGRKPKISV